MEPMSGERTCPSCGAPMQEGQDWCLQCGAGSASSTRGGPGWRSAAAAIGATAALALGAAAAAYAALQQHPAHKPPAPVAQTPPATTPPTTTQPPGSLPGTTTPGGSAQTPSSPGLGQPQTLKVPKTTPKIPPSIPTPRRNGNQQGNRTSAKHAEPGDGGQEPGSNEKPEEQEGHRETGEQPKQPVPILLDTNAAQVYNPNALPESRFGDPSLATDGEATTAWSVQLEAAEAPAVGVGLALDLHTPLRVARLALITDTPGITVQVYGDSGRKLPETLSSEGWVRLSRAHLVKRRKATIELGEASRRFRRLLIWIVKAPVSSAGQFTGAEAKVNEIQLYEAK